MPTRDPRRAVAFWTQKIGLTVASDQPFDDSHRWVELRLPGADTRLVLVVPDGPVPTGVSHAIAFTTDDVARTYAELKAKGVEFVSPPERADWGTSAVFRDSEGNSFVIASNP